jgi:hypothetical protein
VEAFAMLEEQQIAGNLITFRNAAVAVGADVHRRTRSGRLLHGMARAFFIAGQRDLMPMRHHPR